MRKISPFNLQLKRSALLCVMLLAVAHIAFAQANYWSVFGISGCNNSNAMNMSIPSPTSAALTAQTSLNDIYVTSSNPYPLAYTTYNSGGQPLFSVDQNGIYKPNGTLVYDFTIGYTTTIIDVPHL